MSACWWVATWDSRSSDVIGILVCASVGLAVGWRNRCSACLWRGTDGRGETVGGRWNVFCRRWAAVDAVWVPAPLGIAELVVCGELLLGSVRLYGVALEAGVLWKRVSLAAVQAGQLDSTGLGPVVQAGQLDSTGLEPVVLSRRLSTR